MWKRKEDNNNHQLRKEETSKDNHRNSNNENNKIASACEGKECFRKWQTQKKRKDYTQQKR